MTNLETQLREAAATTPDREIAAPLLLDAAEGLKRWRERAEKAERELASRVEPEAKPACKCGPTWTAADCAVHGDPAALTGAARPAYGGVFSAQTGTCTCGDLWWETRQKNHRPGCPLNRSGDAPAP